jgi:putative MATE family efflux protein
MSRSTNTSDEIHQENKMGVMPIPKLIFNMSIPMVISMLLQALYNIVDSAFVGMYSSDALEAVSIAFPVQNLMIAVATGTGVGINALLSRHLGEKRYDAADKTANTGIFLAACSYIAFALLGLILVRPFYEMQSNLESVVVYGEEYLTIITVCGFGLFGEIVGERLLQSTGRTFYSMITQGIGAIINIILDPIMIFGLFGMPRMGVTGAAVATVIGQCIACVLAMIFNVKINKDIHIRFRMIIKPIKAEIAKIYEIGIPSIIMASITSVLTVGMNLILKGFSEDAITVFGVYFKLNSFIFMPVFGLNNGLVPIMSYNYGAKKPERIKKSIRLGMSCAVAYMLFGLIIFQTIPDKLLMIFSANEGVMSIGVIALRIISLSFIFAGVGIVSSTVFQAVGNPLHSLLMSVLRQLVIILPVAYLLSLTGNVDNVWWSYPIAEVCSFLLCLFFMRKTLRKLKEVLSN